MPGVLIIEALAQTGAVAILSKDEFKGKIAYFAGIDKAKFRRKVVPGDTLRLEVELTKLRGRAGVGYGIAYVDDKKEMCIRDRWYTEDDKKWRRDFYFK